MSEKIPVGISACLLGRRFAMMVGISGWPLL